MKKLEQLNSKAVEKNRLQDFYGGLTNLKRFQRDTTMDTITTDGKGNGTNDGSDPDADI